MNAGHLSQHELINRDTLKFLWEIVLSYIIFLIITIPFIIIIMSFFVIILLISLFGFCFEVTLKWNYSATISLEQSKA